MKSGDQSLSQLLVKDIDPFLCTHINVGFATIEENELRPIQASDVQVYKDAISLKKQNPNLKVLLSVGGALASSGFSELVRDPKAVESFSKNTVKFLQSYGFDGIDLDWEFPAYPWPTADSREKQWFTNLLEKLSCQLKSSPTTPLLLTLAVASPKSIIQGSYEVDKIAKYVDFVSMMGYDFHFFSLSHPFTGYNAPLARRSSEIGCFATMNIEWCAKNWIKKGMPKDKLVIGVPTYGRTWKLLNQAWHSVGSLAVGKGMYNGALSYPRAYFFIKEGAEHHMDPESKVPYAWRGRDWMSYEDSDSIEQKAKWIRDNGYAGVMTWNLNCDDWAGECSGKKFELHNVIKEVITERL
ncbi:hypothetical protein Pcinc_027713 [Petrolisthes cinctipes]|uniref:GH18 domain-containing protein n=1 Tax=Petrolisthes cinctipes TaxID=88211 RepID=A0AAE1F4M9_PETCI|nr:hypothetical protein Pcinc_027713 [Petrolisthes cinctipes]